MVFAPIIAEIRRCEQKKINKPPAAEIVDDGAGTLYNKVIYCVDKLAMRKGFDAHGGL